MAETGTATASVTRTAVASITSTAIAIETTRLARLIVARRLVFVFRLRGRFLLCKFGRRSYVERIVPRFM
jgi:hypothetical protein